MPPKRSQSTKFQNFHFFARPLCQKALRQRLRAGFILHPTGPASERPYAFEGGPLYFGPRPPWAAHPQKSFPQISKKILGDGASFLSALHGDPQGTSGIKFWQLYLGPFWQEKIPKFRRKSTISRVTRISNLPKIYGLCAHAPSISGPKCSQIAYTSEIFRAKNRLSSWPPCTQPPVRGVSYV